MTLVVAQEFNGKIQIVADTRLSLAGLEHLRTGLAGDAVKVSLLTRKCCVAFGRNAAEADNILAEYRSNVLPMVTRVHPYSRNVEVLPDFQSVTLEYFRRRTIEAQRPSDSVEFVMGFCCENPQLYLLRGSTCRQLANETVFLGDDTAREQYEELISSDDPQSDGFSLRVRFAEVTRAGEPHPDTDVTPSLTRMLSTLEHIIEAGGNDSVGGVVTGVYSYDSGFYYHRYGSLTRSAVDQDSAIAYAVLPPLNDPHRLLMYLGSRESTDRRTAILYAPLPLDAEEPTRRTEGGFIVPCATATYTGNGGDFEEAVYSRLGIEIELPTLNVRNSTNVVMFPLHSKIERLRKTAGDLVADAERQLKVCVKLNRQVWKSVQLAYLVCYRLMHAHEQSFEVLGSMANLCAMAAERADASRARRLLRASSKLAAELRMRCPDDLGYRLGAALIEFKSARHLPTEAAQNELALRCIDEMAACLAQGEMTKMAGDAWVDSMTSATVEAYGEDRLKRHLELAIRTFGKPSRTMKINRVYLEWWRSRLMLRRLDCFGVPLSESRAIKLSRALSRVLLNVQPTFLVYLLLARSLLICATSLSPNRQFTCLASALPYFRRAHELAPENLLVLANFARTALGLAAKSTPSVRQGLLAEAQQLMTAIAEFHPDYPGLRILKNALSTLARSNSKSAEQ